MSGDKEELINAITVNHPTAKQPSIRAKLSTKSVAELQQLAELSGINVEDSTPLVLNSDDMLPIPEMDWQRLNQKRSKDAPVVNQDDPELLECVPMAMDYSK